MVHGQFRWKHETYAGETSRQAVLDMVAELEGTVRRSAESVTEGIDADILVPKASAVATNPAQLVSIKRRELP